MRAVAAIAGNSFFKKRMIFEKSPRKNAFNPHSAAHLRLIFKKIVNILLKCPNGFDI